jgi:HK97 family phage major capsid protein
MGEGQEATPQKMQLRAITLKLNKLAIYSRASTELTTDGLDFDRQLSMGMSSALAFDLDEAFIRGIGVGMPTGLMIADSRITVAKDTTTSPVQPAGTIRYKNIIDMWSRMHPSCHANSVWIVHPECVPQLFRMSFDEESTTKTPVYLPANGAAGSPFGTLMGRPVLLSEHASPLGDEGDIILVDLTQYAIGLRSEATLQRSIHEAWLTDEVDYRLIIRVTGLPLWATAITPRHGTNTLSWCITLANR